MNFKELVEKKNDLITRAEEVLNSAKTENRELTDAEVEEINGIKNDVTISIHLPHPFKGIFFV